jgi:hypothetical protein
MGMIRSCGNGGMAEVLSIEFASWNLMLQHSFCDMWIWDVSISRDFFGPFLLLVPNPHHGFMDK